LLHVLIVEKLNCQLFATALQRLDRLLNSYLHEMPISQRRHQQLQNIVDKFLLLNDAVHELQSLMPHILIWKDRPQQIFGAA
jgi:transcriptional regulator of heat shock response